VIWFFSGTSCGWNVLSRQVLGPFALWYGSFFGSEKVLFSLHSHSGRESPDRFGLTAILFS
jgi:hypothetical protein